MLAPFAPFAAEELWREELGSGSSVHVSSWPAYDPALAAEDTVTLVVQVDGKVRDKIEVPADADEEAVPGAAPRRPRRSRARWTAATSRKEIVRAPKLVNFVTRALTSRVRVTPVTDGLDARAAVASRAWPSGNASTRSRAASSSG